ncbi:MAG: hypothetical protein AAF322_03250, partial [Pseudomonadota bacterium]
MATITVTSLADDGSGGLTLREALAAAEAMEGADEIVFDAALKDRTIVLTDRLVVGDADGVTIRGDVDGDGEIDITISGDVDGDGRFNSTLYGGTDDARRIDADDSDFLFNAAGSRLSVVGVEFDHGAYVGTAADDVDPGPQGVIVNEGDLSLTDVRIDGAKIDAGGDASRDAAVIVNRAGATLMIRDVIFDDLYVKGGEAPDARAPGVTGGGAALIHNSGDLDAMRFTTSGRFYGGAGAAALAGPGVYVTDGGDATAWVLNEGRATTDFVAAARTGQTLAVAGGARGRLVDLGPPVGVAEYGEYGEPNSTIAITNTGDGAFEGASLLGVFADQSAALSDYSAGPPSSSVASPEGGV